MAQGEGHLLLVELVGRPSKLYAAGLRAAPAGGHGRAVRANVIIEPSKRW
jgi:hypothetical protein